MRRSRIAAITLGLCLAGASPALADDADRVIATVDGTNVTLGHMAVLFDALPAQYKSLPDEMLFQALLEQIIQQTALSKSIEASISARDTALLENERRASLATMALQRQVDAAVTEEALQAAYDARFQDAQPQTEYNAAHILVETEEEAAALLVQIEDGADFAELAREHSRDGAAAGGGSLGWFGAGMMVPSFEEAVIALQPGEVGGPLETQFGWHLVRLNETRIAEAPALDQVRGELAAELEQSAVEAHIEAVTEAAEVTRMIDGLDQGAFRNPELFGN